MTQPPESPPTFAHAPAPTPPETSRLFRLRPAVAGDLPFILNSWLRSYWESSPFVRGVPKETFFREHHALAQATLANAATLIACPADSPDDLIAGWACVDSLPGGGLVVHYVYVKEAFRRFGCARQLVSEFKVDSQPPNFILASHMTPKTEKGDITYSPYLLPYSVGFKKPPTC